MVDIDCKSSNMGTKEQKSPHFSGNWAGFIEIDMHIENQDFLYQQVVNVICKKEYKE